MSAADAAKLREAQELIRDPARWTCGMENENARGKTGREVKADGRAAVSWCALGALDRVGASRSAYRLLDDASGGMPAHLINDTDGHAAVMAIYDRAIALAEAQP